MKIEIIKKISFVIFVILFTSVVVFTAHIDKVNEPENKMYKVSDRVSVSQDIIEGYEGEDYIPRCVSCGIRDKK